MPNHGDWNENFGYAFNARRVEILRSMVDGEQSNSCLDIGSGGTGLLRSLGLRSVSFDIAHVPDITLVASADSLPFRNESFSLVFAGEVIEHLYHPSQALRDWMRVLRKNGVLILSTPNGILVGTEGNNPGHRFAFSLNGLKASLEFLGLEVVATNTIYAAMITKRIFRLIPARLKLPLLRIYVPSPFAYDLFLKARKK